MSKKSRKKRQKMTFDIIDDFDDLYDDTFDMDEFARDIHSTDWGDENENPLITDPRRRIERRRDLKKLYTELEDWEEFGQ